MVLALSLAAGLVAGGASVVVTGGPASAAAPDPAPVSFTGPEQANPAFTGFDASVVLLSTARGDVDGDGRDDVAVVGFGNVPGVGMRTFLKVFRGVGDGTLAGPILDVPLTGGAAGSVGYWASVVLGRFTDSGHLDLLVSQVGEANLHLYAGNGDGTFAAPSTVPIGVQAGLLRADAAGNVVALGAYASSSTWSYLRRTGSGTWAETSTSTGGYNVVDAAFVPVGARTDLVVTRPGGQPLVFTGTGPGTFDLANPATLPVNDARMVVAGDFRGTGHTDLLFGNCCGELTLARGDGTGGYALPSQPSASVPGRTRTCRSRAPSTSTATVRRRRHPVRQVGGDRAQRPRRRSAPSCTSRRSVTTVPRTSSRP
ncbi:MAG: VCBS repeat-containing protein [Acidimicrobiales bacterium]